MKTINWKGFGPRIKRIIGLVLIIAGLVTSIYVVEDNIVASSNHSSFLSNTTDSPISDVAIQGADISTAISETSQAWLHKAFRNPRGTQAFYGFYRADLGGIDTIYYAWSTTGYTWPANQVDLQALTTAEIAMTGVAIVEDDVNSQLIVYVMGHLENREETRIRRGVILDTENTIRWDPEEQLWGSGYTSRGQAINIDPQGYLWALAGYSDASSCRLRIKVSQTVRPLAPIAWSEVTELDSTPQWCWQVSLVPYTTTTNIVAIGMKGTDGNAWACAVTWNGGIGAPTSQGKSQDPRYYYAYGPSGDGVKADSGLIHYAFARGTSASPTKVYYYMTWDPATKQWGDRITVYDGKDDTDTGSVLVCDTSRTPNYLYYIYEHGSGIIEYKTSPTDQVVWSAPTQIEDHSENCGLLTGWPANVGQGTIFGMYRTMATYTVRSFLLSPAPPVTTSATTTPPVTTPTITGWLAGWAHRKRHTIQGSSAQPVANYQIRINVHRTSGSDSGNDVYLDTKCKADFGDIRFTKADGRTELDYWLEGYSGNDAIFWVEIDNIPASPNTVDIYIYYGNSAASTTSDGNETFLFFDDFEDGSLSGTKWDSDGWNRFNGLGAYITEEDGVIKITGDGSNYRILVAKYTLDPSDTYAIHSKIKKITNNCYCHFAMFDGTEEGSDYDDRVCLLDIGKDGDWDIRNRVLGVDEDVLNIGTWAADTWYKLRITRHSTTKCGAKLTEEDDTELYSGTWTHASWNVNMWGVIWAKDTVVKHFEYYFIRNFVDPEPTHTSWGSEESEFPTVTVGSPNGGEVWSGTQSITWTVTDPQDDPLAYTVYYSPNGGTTWTQLATGLTEPSYQWDTTTVMDGGNYLIKVEVNDGENIRQDVSDASFEIANVPITTTTPAPLTETVPEPETTSPTPVTTPLTTTPSIPTTPRVPTTLFVVLGLGLVAGLGGGLWVLSKRRAGPSEPVPEGPPPTELRAPVPVQEYDPDVALATLKQLATVYERVAWQTLMDEFHFTDDIDLQTLLFRAGLSGELEVKIDEMTKMVRLQVVEYAEPLMPKKFACPTCGAALEPHESSCPACGATFPSCIICRRPVQENLTKTPCCGAYAHEPHLKEWIHIRGTCPMCREKLSDWMLP